MSIKIEGKTDTLTGTLEITGPFDDCKVEEIVNFAIRYPEAIYTVNIIDGFNPLDVNGFSLIPTVMEKLMATAPVGTDNTLSQLLDVHNRICKLYTDNIELGRLKDKTPR